MTYPSVDECFARLHRAGWSIGETAAGFPHAFGVDVGLRQHVAAKQEGNLVGVDLVGLGLAAVDGFHVEGVSEDSSLSPAGR